MLKWYYLDEFKSKDEYAKFIEYMLKNSDFFSVIYFRYNECIFRKNCASVPEERSAIPLQTEQSSAG